MLNFSSFVRLQFNPPTSNGHINKLKLFFTSKRIFHVRKVKLLLYSSLLSLLIFTMELRYKIHIEIWRLTEIRKNIG